MYRNYKPTFPAEAFSEAVQKLRGFCLLRGFLEVHTQDRLSILAACEDPTTVAVYEYEGQTWPLPQTGQMWLEYELLTRPQIPGVFCLSTSFRNEQNPVPGRHKIIFPMFEFESKGTIDDLRSLEEDLVKHLGFKQEGGFIHQTYDQLADKYNTKEISHYEENKMEEDLGPVVFLEQSPVRTSPFWNMRKNGEYANRSE